MLSVNFPNGKKIFDKNEEECKIEVNFYDETGLLSIEAHFDGYSYFLSEYETRACCENDLNKTELLINADCDLSAHEFSSHSEDNPDLQVESASIIFKTSENGIIKIEAEGNVSVYEGEDTERFNFEDKTFTFNMEADLKIEPGDWLMDLAHGYEINTLELYGKDDEKIEQVFSHLHGMADINNTKATELITLFDRRDDRSVHCYGKGDRIIIECTFPHEGNYKSFVLSVKNSLDVEEVSFKPDSVNSEIKVTTDEFFSVEECENVLKYFILNRTIDTDKFILKDKSYLFKMA